MVLLDIRVVVHGLVEAEAVRLPAFGRGNRSGRRGGDGGVRAAVHAQHVVKLNAVIGRASPAAPPGRAGLGLHVGDQLPRLQLGSPAAAAVDLIDPAHVGLLCGEGLPRLIGLLRQLGGGIAVGKIVRPDCGLKGLLFSGRLFRLLPCRGAALFQKGEKPALLLRWLFPARTTADRLGLLLLPLILVPGEIFTLLGFGLRSLLLRRDLGRVFGLFHRDGWLRNGIGGLDRFMHLMDNVVGTLRCHILIRRLVGALRLMLGKSRGRRPVGRQLCLRLILCKVKLIVIPAGELRKLILGVLGRAGAEDESGPALNLAAGGLAGFYLKLVVFIPDVCLTVFSGVFQIEFIHCHYLPFSLGGVQTQISGFSAAGSHTW